MHYAQYDMDVFKNSLEDVARTAEHANSFAIEASEKAEAVNMRHCLKSNRSKEASGQNVATSTL